MVDINALIANEMKNRGYDSYSAVPVTLNVTKPDTIIDLNSYIYLFVSEAIDTKIHTVVELKSPDNTLIFNKTLLETMNTQNLFFSEELEIEVKHYGHTEAEFLPFRLGFWRISPIKK